MARVTLGFAGEDVIVGGSDIQVIGTSAGGEVITVISGNIRLDPSFNQGGDTVILPGLASDYTAYRAGGEVILTRLDGGVTIRIPIGSAGIEVEFTGGDSRTLLFNSGTGQATLEGQAIGTSSTAQTALTPAGPAPLVNYDVVGANAVVAEGDSGTRQLVFTITLDRAVTAADGAVTLNYVTQNGTADSATDYVAAAGTVTFAVGQQVATVTVTVNGDVVPETNETLTLLLTGARLRNGPETLTGTINNDDVAVSLTGAADNLLGSTARDQFFAANTGLGAGDKITDVTADDNDIFTLSVDATTGNRNFGGFALSGIENVAVTNDSGQPVTLDLSSSTGIASVASVNSSDTVIFDQLTSNASVIVDDVTGTKADVVAIYQAAVTSGANTIVNVIVNDATADEIVLRTVGAGNSGIETVNLTVTGSSSINQLNTQLTTLNINGGGEVTINDALVNTIRTIDASAAGQVDIDFSNNDAPGTGVTFTGSNGDDIVVAGTASDNISTGLGSDFIINEGGDDVISTGGGDDLLLLFGAGNVNVNTGGDNDTVNILDGGFNGNDTLAFGDGSDLLIVAQNTVESDYLKVTGLETLTVNSVAVTNLGNNLGGSAGEAAGIRTVNLNVSGFGGSNDTLIATDYAAGLTVNLGGVAGTDTVQLGAGADVVNTSSFDNSDVIQGNGGSDTINVQDGANNIDGSSQFSGVETINILSDGDGDDQNITVDDSNAPTIGSGLTINAGSNISTESVSFNSAAVTAYSVAITTGAGADTINTNNGVADVVTSGMGNDSIVAAGGDTINAGAGADNVILFAGNNTVFGGADNDRIEFGGVGDNKLYGEGGNDTFFVVATADLTATDTLDGGDGTDTIDIIGTVVDAQFTNTSNVEILLGGGGGTVNYTLGAEAQEAGIRTITLTDGGVDVVNASAFTAGLTVNSSGGNDKITTGSGADIINVGIGSYTIDTGAGNDSIRVSGSELDATDKIAGGADNDVIEFDNTAGGVTGVVDLTNVTGIESFTILASGDRLIGSDPDANILTFTSTLADVVTSVTPVNINAGALSDQEDSFTVVIGASVLDSDFSFNVTGGATGTTVDKQNVGINNNITFIGGSGVDTLRIAGSDAGSTVVFSGGGGNDRLIQTGASILTDDGFIGLSSVEVLGADTAINAVIGSRAAAAGIVSIAGTANNDLLIVGAGFTSALSVVLGAGNDTINAGASSAAITFNAAAADYTAADILTGGTGLLDTVNITAGGTANLNSVTQVENINVNNVSALGAEGTVIDLDWSTIEVNGTRITVNVLGAGSNDTLSFNGGALAENVTVNAGIGVDLITTGSGTDIVNAGGGNDAVAAGAGADLVNAGEGNDVVRGEAGADVINGDDGNDTLYGDINFADVGTLALYNASAVGNDTINGGIGDDLIVGGLGKDTLTGGAGVDTFRYFSVEDSRFAQSAGAPVDNRDIITDFVAGVDEIDITTLAAAIGQTIRFNGDFATYAEAQAAVGSTAADGFLDVAFVRNLGGQSVLFVDVDNNGQLDGNDLQIILQNVTGTLTAGDVNNPHLVTGPEGLLSSDVGSSGIGDVGQQVSIRYEGLFDSLQFA